MRAARILAAASGVAAAAFAWAEPVPVLSVAASADRAEIRSGESFGLRVEVRLGLGWHIYSLGLKKGGLPTRLSLAPGHPFGEAGPWRESPTHPYEIEGLDPLPVHEGQAVFTLPISAPAGMAPAAYKISGAVEYQACNEEGCLPTRRDPFEAEVRISPGEARPGFAPRPGPQGPSQGNAGSDVERAIREGLGAFLALAVASGLAALLMPCVYPMIPVTVSFFAKEAERRGKPPVLLAALYAAGIVGSFTGIGLLFSAVFGASIIDFVAHPGVNLTIASLFFVFALSLFGLFEIRLPSFVVNAAGGADRSGAIGVLVMGVAFSVASFTCTVQFVGTLLVLAAERGDPRWPAVGLLVFSATMAAPFFILSLFPSYVASAPKAGGWMHAAKIVFAWVEVAAVAAYLAKAENPAGWGILTRPVVLASWCFCTAVSAIYLAGWCFFPGEAPPARTGLPRRLLAAAFAGLTLYLGSGLSGEPLAPQLEAFLPPLRYGMARGDGNGADAADFWVRDLAAAEAQAKREGKLLLLNFTGIT